MPFPFSHSFYFSLFNFPFSLSTSPHINLSQLPSLLSLRAHPSSLGGVRNPLEWETLAVLINTLTSREWREAVEGKQWQQCWRKMSREVGKGFVLAEQKHLFLHVSNRIRLLQAQVQKCNIAACLWHLGLQSALIGPSSTWSKPPCLGCKYCAGKLIRPQLRPLLDMANNFCTELQLRNVGWGIKYQC